MTPSEIITKLDSLKPNGYTDQNKLDWLNQVERRVYDEIVCTHEQTTTVTLTTYTISNKSTATVLVPDAYAELYLHYMSAQIDYLNGEFNRYNNTMSMFNSTYNAYYNAYNRENEPLCEDLAFF